MLKYFLLIFLHLLFAFHIFNNLCINCNANVTLQEHFGTVYETNFRALLSKTFDVEDNEVCKRSNSIFWILHY